MGFFKKKEKERLMFEISMETREIEDTKANLEYDKTMSSFCPHSLQ